MMKTVRNAILTLFAMVAAYSCGGGSDSHVADEEEIRLLKIGRIDSVSIPSVIYPDSIRGAETLASLTAEAWILIDDGTGCLISEKNADKRMYMASLTKMMTCLLALERGRMDDSIYITEDVFISRDSRVRLGQGYLLADLIDEMMLTSDNDAAFAIAKHLGGSVDDFSRMMNEKAAYLGMDGTHFANPNGTPNDSNYSTARDLARLTRYAMCDSAFASIVGTAEKRVPLLDGRHMDCQNTNMLLKTYKGCIGVKTGFTRQAGNCLASAATRDDTTLILILLNSRTMNSRFTESASLLDYGFRVMKAFRSSK